MRSLVPGLLSVARCSRWVSQTQTLPPPFPRPGAKQLLDNERVTVWDVVWPKGQPTARHRHPYALAGVYLESGDRVITDADGSKRNVTNPAGGVTFQLKGLLHIEEGTSDAPLHAIMIEMKQDAPVGDNPSPEAPQAFPREGATQLLDNERVRIWDYTFTKGHVSPAPPPRPRRHRRLDGGRQAALDAAGRRTQYHDADEVHRHVSRRGNVHTEETLEGALRVYIFELK